MSVRPSYEYRAPLMYVKPIAELEAVETALNKNPFALKQGILIRL